MPAKSRRAPPKTRSRLEEYRRKRDFRKTAEPSGDVDSCTRRGGLQFVIQKHAASHLHYDLRLELDGVMRSWAVPKGPSLNPAVKRLAMQVEDHPMGYNTFEGTIPKGEYGGGTVMLWDRGSYSADERNADESDEDAVRRGLKAGKLAFTFHGERLQGSFALVRTERGPKPKWLLIKHRDDSADEGAEITDEVMTSVTTGRTMQEIAAEQDRVWRSNRGGRRGGEEEGSGASNEPTIAPMKPTPSRALPKRGTWLFEPWRGGERVLVYATPDVTRIVNDRGRNAGAKHRGIVDAVTSFAARAKTSLILEAELTDDALFVSDVLLQDGNALLDRPFTARREALESLLRRRRIAGVKLSPLDEDGDRAMKRARSAGHAGVLARRANGVYEPGVKSDALLRIPLA